MNKEIIYLSLPDHFNKNLFTNYNQKVSKNNILYLQFVLKQNSHLGSAIKAIYLLELIFPKKAQSLKLKIKLRKEFGSKNKKVSLFFFNLNLTGFEFVDFYRFFINRPINIRFIKTMDIIPITNRKLKLFEYSNNLKIVPKKMNYSLRFLELNHMQ